MSDHVVVQIREAQPWIDHSQPPPPAKIVDTIKMEITKADMAKRWAEIRLALSETIPGRLRSVSRVVPGQGEECDVLVVYDPGTPAQRIRRRPTHRVGVQGGPLGRKR